MNSVVEWRKGVQKSYGSLEAFTHPSTVKFMLSLIERDIANEMQMRGWLKDHPEDLKEWIAGSEPEYSQHLEIQKELTQWLSLKTQKTVQSL